MARLYEYQGKDLFRSMGIPVPRGRVAKDPIDAARIAQELGSPVAVKAQVLMGGRGRAGGIRFAATPEEARMTAWGNDRTRTGGKQDEQAHHWSPRKGILEGSSPPHR